MPFFSKKNSFHTPFTPFPTKKHPFQKLKTSECPLRKNTPIKSIKTRLSPNFYFSQNFQVVSIFGSEENLWRKTETKTGGQASEMPNDAKHHASENRKAIERSLVTGTRGGVEPRRGSVVIVKKERLASRLTLSEAHIV